jgi:hypothetical protein
MTSLFNKRPPRFELKFITPLGSSSELMRELQSHCDYDSYSGKNGEYEVASVYYDTPNLNFHFAREESVGYRRKVRLRAYMNNGKCKGLFLEIKEKHKNQVAKKRCPLNKELFFKNNYHTSVMMEQLLKLCSVEDVTFKELSYLNEYYRLDPAILVRYIRQTLIGKYDNGLRITLDRQLTVGGSSLYSFNNAEENFLLPPHLAILEIKCYGSLPLWLQHIVRKYGLCRTKFSKYCEGIKLHYPMDKLITMRKRNSNINIELETYSTHNESLQNFANY